MSNLQKTKNKARSKRKLRSRGKMFGTAERPRLSVFKSLRHIYVQIVDDQSQKSITGVSTLTPDLAGEKISKLDKATKVGELLAAKAKDKGIETVIFDRTGYLYHGRIKALAEGARKGGLKF